MRATLALTFAVLVVQTVGLQGCGSEETNVAGSYQGTLTFVFTGSVGGSQTIQEGDVLLNEDAVQSVTVPEANLQLELFPLDGTCLIYGAASGNDVSIPEQIPLCEVVQDPRRYSVNTLQGTGVRVDTQLTL